jgi:hypothetical protein
MRNQEEGLAGPSRLLHRPRPQQKEPTKLPLVGLSTSTSIVQTAPPVATVAAKTARSKQRQLLVCRLATRDALGGLSVNSLRGLSPNTVSPARTRHASRRLARRGLAITGSPRSGARPPRTHHHRLAVLGDSPATPTLPAFNS